MVIIARKTKCPVCSEMFDRDQVEFFHFKNRYYHKKCYDDMVGKSQQEQKDKDELENYIEKLFKKEIDVRIRQQIKKMKEEFGYTYSGILKSLVYFYEVKNGSIEKANGGIGIVPYVYSDARQYYYDLYLKQKVNEGKDLTEYVVPAKVVVIKSPKRKPKERRLFNLEEE